MDLKTKMPTEPFEIHSEFLVGDASKESKLTEYENIVNYTKTAEDIISKCKAAIVESK